MAKEKVIMFKKYMLEGTLDPEVQAVFRAAADISNGVFSLQEAANHYKLHPTEIGRASCRERV